MLMVVPVWNEHANEHVHHKNVVIEVFSTHAVAIDEIDQQYCKEYFKWCLMQHALEQPETKRAKINRLNPVGYQITTLNVGEMFVGYLYFKNSTDTKLKVELTARINGFDLPDTFLATNGKYELKIKPNDSVLIWLKQKSIEASFGCLAKGI